MRDEIIGIPTVVGREIVTAASNMRTSNGIRRYCCVVALACGALCAAVYVSDLVVEAVDRPAYDNRSLGPLDSGRCVVSLAGEGLALETSNDGVAGRHGAGTVYRLRIAKGRAYLDCVDRAVVGRES